MPFLLIGASLAIPLCVHMLSARRRALRYPLGRCEHCGYDLRGTVTAGREFCPECGRLIEPHLRELAREAARVARASFPPAR